MSGRDAARRADRPPTALERTSRVGLSPHADLKSRAEGEILVLPEQAIRVGGSGAEILRLVEKETTVGSLLETLRRRYPDSPDLEAEVLGFLTGMIEARAIIRLEAASERASERHAAWSAGQAGRDRDPT